MDIGRSTPRYQTIALLYPRSTTLQSHLRILRRSGPALPSAIKVYAKVDCSANCYHSDRLRNIRFSIEA
jgi:hypothetical protein